MKRFILTSILSVLAFVGFTSAELITFEGNQNTKVYTPNTITFGEDINITYDNYTDYISNISCNATVCHILIGECNIAGSADFMRNISNCNLSAGTYQIGFDSLQYATLFSTITIDNLSSSSSGGSSSDSDSSTLLPNGVSELTPVVTGVSTIVGEFIPYVIYCSIGILLAILGFVAIKRLMNYMTRKIISIFSSKRRK